MTRIRPLPATAILALLGFATSCTTSEPEPVRTGVIEVRTTFYPTTYFAERIGGERVHVVCPTPADADPIFWMPDEGAIGDYQSAELIVLNGAEFEKWVSKVTLPERRVVRTAAPFADQLLRFEQAMTHSHGPGG
ncbi:MAG: zinc ABC transporter substrate-binding protein, partial [Planctomycetes bacterium]|nr:zinc ABC transporter substrate-binding protein [Planctomycetota bacterium]